MLALCCLLFRELEASQLTLPGHWFGLEMPVPDLALLSYLPVTCQDQDQLVLLPPLHLGHQLSSVCVPKMQQNWLFIFVFLLLLC